jgi:hypothetical protein
MKFSEVAVGQQFKANGTTYTKTDTVKVSCCRSVNAKETASGNNVFIDVNQEVELVTE